MKFPIFCFSSRIHGDGLFARKILEKGRVVSYYNGFKIPSDSIKEAYLRKMNNDDQDFEEYLERKSYLIALDTEYDLDIPPWIANNSDSYVATLGHKINHWFKPNCYFGWAVHPLYGR